MTSEGGNPETGKAFDAVLTGDACKTVPQERARGTAIAQRRLRGPRTLLGLPTLKATVRTTAAAPIWPPGSGTSTTAARRS